MEQLQGKVADFVRRHRLEADIEHRLLDLFSEVGELTKEALRSSSYGSQPFKKTAAWNDELGDVFFSLLCLANITRVDLEKALDGALEKYAGRIEKRGSADSGD